MFFAKQKDKTDFYVFLSFLKNYLETKNEEEKQMFVEILQNAKAVLEGGLQFYEIKRDYFSIVLYLIDNYEDEIRNLDIQHLSDANLEQLKGYLENALTSA